MQTLWVRLDARFHVAAAAISAFALGLTALAGRFVIYGVPSNVFRPIWGVVALLAAGIVAAFWLTPRRRYWRLVASAAAYLLVFVALVAEVGNRFWVAELVTHFRLQLTAGLLTVAIAAGMARHWTAAVLAGLACAWQTPTIAPYAFGVSQPTVANAQPLRVLFANVLFINDDFSSLRNLVATTQPDVVAAAELTYDWQRELESLNETYKYRKILSAPNDSVQGVAIWSKRSIKHVTVHRTESDDPPWLLVEFDSETEPLTLAIAHPPNPVYPKSMVVRDRQLREIAMTLRERKGHIVAVGDFNAAPWSPIVRDFCNRSRLRDARLGFGAHPTWPAHAPGMRVPIDHCLVSERIAVRGFKRPPSIGSDHLPILVDLELPGKP